MAVGYRGRIVTGIGEDHSWASFASANRAVRHRRTAQCSFCPYFTKLNRSATIDSQLSLDAWARLRDPLTMIAQPYHLYIERTDAEEYGTLLCHIDRADPLRRGLSYAALGTHRN